MRRTSIAVLVPIAASIYAVAVQAGEPAGRETGVTPPGSMSAAAPGSGAPATSATAPVPGASASAAAATAPLLDPNLMAELAKAEGAENAQRQRESASNTEAPKETAPLGQETVGNETNPAIALLISASGSWFAKDERIHQGGHSPKRTGPELQSASLAVQGPIDPFFRAFAAANIAHMALEEAYVTTTALPLNLKVRAGKFLADVGRQNMLHMHQWHFASKPLPNEYLFGPPGLRLPGAELSLLLPLPWYVEVIGAVQMGDGHSFNTRPEDRGEPTYRDFVYPGRVVQFFDVADDWAFQVGVNTVQGRSSKGERGADRTQAYGADLFLKWRPIGAGSTGYTYVATTVEGWHRTMEAQAETWRGAGGYADVTIGLDKEWDTAIRGELWRRLDDDGPGDIALADRLSHGIDVVRGNAQLSYMPSHFSRVRVQYIIEKAELYELNHIGTLQLEVSAGAHGAHTY